MTADERHALKAQVNDLARQRTISQNRTRAMRHRSAARKRERDRERYARLYAATPDCGIDRHAHVTAVMAMLDRRGGTT